MANTKALISNEWKHTLETTPTSSVSSLVSLYDLFYDTDKTLWVEKTGDANIGCQLDHDVICLYKGMLGSGNKIDVTTTISQSPWMNFGIDASIPIYDARSKCKEVSCNSYITNVNRNSNIPVFSNGKYYIYDKDAALAPKTVNKFTLRGVLTSSNTTSSEVSWDTYLAPSIGVYDGESTQYDNDILLSCSDTALKSALVTQDGYDAYDRIIFNPYTWYSVCLVVKATGMDITGLLTTSSLKDGSTTYNSNIISTFGSLQNFWNRTENETNSSEYVARSIDLGGYATIAEAQAAGVYDENRWFNLLKNTFVWVRAPFYGDYIKPSSFGQDLNASAKVVHNELMLSGAGDFKKYDVYNTSDGQELSSVSMGIGASSSSDSLSELSLSETTLPYIPKTSPTVDIYTSSLLDSNDNLTGVKKVVSDSSNYSSAISSESTTEVGNQIDEFLDNDAAGNDPIVRSLPIAAINRTNALDVGNTTTPENLAPPNYFDPESRMSGSDYVNIGKFPTVIPKDGNLYVDGRIIGPTIDEIWIMLKKLTGGRLSDFESDGTTANVKRALNLDIGIPYGFGDTTQNNTDTTMTEVPDSQFNFKYENSKSYNKKGDPIDFTYELSSTDSYNQSIKITKFINQNDAIVYPVYKSLKDLSTDVTKFDVTTDKDREITNFTAWNSFGKGDEVVNDNATILTGAWGPRDVPYSLRELEAMVMGNKFNLITQARFVKENFAVTGKLGKTSGYNEEDMYNYSAGSLYQMHKEYNFDVTNPNTFYNAEGTADGLDNGETIGARAIIDDNDIRTETQIREGHIRFAETYGTSTALNYNAEKYSSSDVYLSASGDWRYVSDHNRIPCLRAEY